MIEQLYAECVFPISGTYTFFQRLLYYLVLIFAFTVRSHDWLLSAALGFALTTSGSAAIHVICLAAQSELPFDIDHVAIRAILVPSLLAIFPLWQYSWRFWNVDITAVLVTWWCLVSVAAYLLNWRIGPLAVNTGYGDFMYCADWETLSVYNTSVQADFGYIYKDMNCTNPCIGVSGSSIFHTATDQLAPFVLDVWDPGSTTFMEWIPVSYDAIMKFTWVAVGLIIAQYWILGSASPSSIRNSIFRAIYRGDTRSYRRYILAKTFALLGYMLPFLAVLILSTDFIVQIVYMEMTLLPIPESESPWAVGQWSPWVGVTMTIVATIGLKLKTLWTKLDENLESTAPSDSREVENEEEAHLARGTDQRPSSSISSGRPSYTRPIIRASTIESIPTRPGNAIVVVTITLLRWTKRVWHKLSNRTSQARLKVARFLTLITQNFQTTLNSSWASVSMAWKDLASFYRDPVGAVAQPLQDDTAVESTELHDITNNNTGHQNAVNGTGEEHCINTTVGAEGLGSSSGITLMNEAREDNAGVEQRTRTWPSSNKYTK